MELAVHWTNGGLNAYGSCYASCLYGMSIGTGWSRSGYTGKVCDVAHLLVDGTECVPGQAPFAEP